jgi:DNA-binding NarL/FixJ family response regulator
MSMIVLSDSRSFERHVARCLPKMRLSFARTSRGLPKVSEGEPPLCLVHVSSFPEPLDAVLAQRLGERGMLIAVASDRPSVEEFLDLAAISLRAYVNSYMADLHYDQMMKVVAAGQTWVVPPILDQALALARSTRRQVREDGEGLDMLTAREREVATAVALGLSNPDIGRRLGISEPTVKVHLGRVFKKMQVRSRFALALKLQGLRQAS